MKRALKVTIGCLLITIAFVLIAHMAGIQMGLTVALILIAKVLGITGMLVGGVYLVVYNLA